MSGFPVLPSQLIPEKKKKTLLAVFTEQLKGFLVSDSTAPP